MRLIIQEDYEGMSLWAAAYTASRIRQHQASESRPFVLGLPTGSTPVGMYRELVRLHKEGIIDMKSLITFNMDEYVGLGAEHPHSFAHFMNTHLFGPIGMDSSRTMLLNGLAEDPEAECRRYEEAIRQTGGIDLFIGGVGMDGHIAFNEPGSSLSSRTRIKTLTMETRRANARFFDNETDRVPAQALTVGVATIMDADEVMILASGPSKSPALRMMVEEGVNHLWPASALQMHPKGILVCDEEAIMDLRVGTVKYFKDIESGQPDPRSFLGKG